MTREKVKRKINVKCVERAIVICSVGNMRRNYLGK
jgi:hypothetical protein